MTLPNTPTLDTELRERVLHGAMLRLRSRGWYNRDYTEQCVDAALAEVTDTIATLTRELEEARTALGGNYALPQWLMDSASRAMHAIDACDKHTNEPLETDALAQSKTALMAIFAHAQSLTPTDEMVERAARAICSGDFGVWERDAHAYRPLARRALTAALGGGEKGE